MSAYLLADTVDFRWKLTQAQSPALSKALSLLPKGSGIWGDLFGEDQHISNLFFRLDRKLSFLIQTALNIILV